MGEDPEAIRADIEQTRAEMSDTVDALGYKADVKSRAKDKINRITGKVSDATPDKGQVKRAASTAQENPLGLAIGGVAVGFLAGLVVPSSRVEDEKLGPIADQVKDQVKETGQEALERGKDVAQQAAETAKEAGREHAQQLGDSTQSRAGAAAPS
jgi:gas vesicle protein